MRDALTKRLPGRIRGSRSTLSLRLVAGAAVLAFGLAGADAAAQDAERIIVSGASGQLGGLVVEELLARGVSPENLILVSRTPESLADYAALGASTRFGDFTQPESLREAYAGGTRMLLISINTLERRPELHGVAIDAAVQAGVRHIAYTSFVDLDNNTSPLAEDHRRTEAILRESGVAWTMLRNQLYMNGLVSQAAGMLATGSVTAPSGQAGTAYVTREDCAAAAAAVLTTAGHENQVYDITGPAIIGPREIAEAASEVTGIPIEIMAAAEPGPGFGGGESWTTVTSRAVEALTGRPAMSIRDLLDMNRAALPAAP